MKLQVHRERALLEFLCVGCVCVCFYNKLHNGSTFRQCIFSRAYWELHFWKALQDWGISDCESPGRVPLQHRSNLSPHLRVCNACLSPLLSPPPPIINPGVADFRFHNAVWCDRYLPGDVPVRKLKSSNAVLPGLLSAYSRQVRSGKGNMLRGNNRGNRFPWWGSQTPRDNMHFVLKWSYLQFATKIVSINGKSLIAREIQVHVKFIWNRAARVYKWKCIIPVGVSLTSIYINHF